MDPVKLLIKMAKGYKIISKTKRRRKTDIESIYRDGKKLVGYEKYWGDKDVELKDKEQRAEWGVVI